MPLNNIRQEIDRIDTQLHELLIKRAGFAKQLSELKKGGPIIHPTRELEVLKTRYDFHEGNLPFFTIYRIWRELTAAMITLQGDFSVAIMQGEKNMEIWDLARSHYGSVTPMSCLNKDVLQEKLNSGEVTVAICNICDPAWIDLVRTNKHVQVIAKLPVLRQEGPQAVCLAKLEAAKLRDDIGDNISLLAYSPDTEPALDSDKIIATHNLANTRVLEYAAYVYPHDLPSGVEFLGNYGMLIKSQN